MSKSQEERLHKIFSADLHSCVSSQLEEYFLRFRHTYPFPLDPAKFFYSLLPPVVADTIKNERHPIQARNLMRMMNGGRPRGPNQPYVVNVNHPSYGCFHLFVEDVPLISNTAVTLEEELDALSPADRELLDAWLMAVGDCDKKLTQAAEQLRTLIWSLSTAAMLRAAWPEATKFFKLPRDVTMPRIKNAGPPLPGQFRTQINDLLTTALMLENKPYQAWVGQYVCRT